MTESLFNTDISTWLTSTDSKRVKEGGLVILHGSEVIVALAAVHRLLHHKHAGDVTLFLSGDWERVTRRRRKLANSVLTR